MEPNPQQENPAEQTVQTEGQPEKAPEPVTPEAGATAGQAIILVCKSITSCE